MKTTRHFRLFFLPCAIALLVSLLTASLTVRPPAHLRPKIFVLGLSKTGTTSIGDALASQGYKRLGWKDIRSRQLVHAWAHNDYEALLHLTEFYDAFEDLPWPFTYRIMAERYPDAKFILNVRKDEKWLKSMRRHVGRGRWKAHGYFYGTEVVDGYEEVVLAAYRNHTENVREYFRMHQSPSRFVEVDIDDDVDVDKWRAICGVALCSPDVLKAVGRGGEHGESGSESATPLSFPKSNTAAQWVHGGFGVKDGLRWVWGWAITRIEETTVDWYYSRNEGSLVRFGLGSCWRLISVLEQACSEVFYKATRDLSTAMVPTSE